MRIFRGIFVCYIIFPLAVFGLLSNNDSLNKSRIRLFGYVDYSVANFLKLSNGPYYSDLKSAEFKYNPKSYSSGARLSLAVGRLNDQVFTLAYDRIGYSYDTNGVVMASSLGYYTVNVNYNVAYSSISFEYGGKFNVFNQQRSQLNFNLGTGFRFYQLYKVKKVYTDYKYANSNISYDGHNSETLWPKNRMSLLCPNIYLEVEYAHVLRNNNTICFGVRNQFYLNDYSKETYAFYKGYAKHPSTMERMKEMAVINLIKVFVGYSFGL